MEVMETTPKTTYIVKTSSAKQRGGWGNYRNVAVLEVLSGAAPKMISERAA